MPTARAPRRITKHDLKSDAFTTSIFAAREWVEEHLRETLIGVGSVIVVVAVVWGLLAWRSGQRLESESLYGEAGVEMRSGNPAVAIAQLQKVLDEHSHASIAGPACFQLAQLHFRQRNFDDARVAFQRYIDSYGKDPMLTAAAWAGLGAVDEQAGQFADAAGKYEKAVAADPKGFRAGEYMRSLIRCAVEGNDSARALAAFATLQKDYPKDNENINGARQVLIERGFLNPGKS